MDEKQLQMIVSSSNQDVESIRQQIVALNAILEAAQAKDEVYSSTGFNCSTAVSITPWWHQYFLAEMVPALKNKGPQCSRQEFPMSNTLRFLIADATINPEWYFARPNISLDEVRKFIKSAKRR